MGLRQEYLADFARRRADSLARHATLVAERAEWTSEIASEIPAFREFERVLLGSGDLTAAVATGALQQLRAAGYIRTQTEYLTESRLRSKAHAWSLFWLSPRVSDVARDANGVLYVADCWQRVDLTVQIDKENRRIDTEFYGLNPSAGEEANEFDDREKLHVVWDVPKEASEPLRLYYLGVGANSPYTLDHPDRPNLDAQGKGKPRFYVYGRDRNPAVHFRHEVMRHDEGPVDWPWPDRPVERRGDTHIVRFVRTCDGTRTCLSDPAAVAAANGQNLDDVVRHMYEKFETGAAPAFVGLSPACQERIRAYFLVEAATVHRVEGPLPAIAPALTDVLEWLRLDYVPYFYATAAATTRARTDKELYDATRRALDVNRRENYQTIFDRPTAEAFEDADLPHLPDTIGELFLAAPQGMPSALAADVASMRAQLRSEIERDLYHYGQTPNERIQHLRLGVHLALSSDWGGVYGHVVAEARKCVDGGQPFGAFDLTWPPSS